MTKSIEICSILEFFGEISTFEGAFTLGVKDYSINSPNTKLTI
jgi:hypothetical protein